MFPNVSSVETLRHIRSAPWSRSRAHPFLWARNADTEHNCNFQSKGFNDETLQLLILSGSKLVRWKGAHGIVLWSGGFTLCGYFQLGSIYRKCLRAPYDGMRLDYAFVTAFCLLLCREPVFGFLKEKNGSQQLWLSLRQLKQLFAHNMRRWAENQKTECSFISDQVVTETRLI